MTKRDGDGSEEVAAMIADSTSEHAIAGGDEGVNDSAGPDAATDDPKRACAKGSLGGLKRTHENA